MYLESVTRGLMPALGEPSDDGLVGGYWMDGWLGALAYVEVRG